MEQYAPKKDNCMTNKTERRQKKRPKEDKRMIKRGLYAKNKKMTKRG